MFFRVGSPPCLPVLSAATTSGGVVGDGEDAGVDASYDVEPVDDSGDRCRWPSFSLRSLMDQPEVGVMQYLYQG
jgi:hypothetical protein